MPRRTVVIAALFALVAASSLGALLTAASSSGTGSPQVVVPVGRIGDHVSYTTFRRNDASEPWTQERSWAFHVKEVGSAVDQSQHGRAAAAFVWQQSASKATFPDLALRWTQTHESVVTAWLDLVDRVPVQLVGSTRVAAAQETSSQSWRVNVTHWWYGPDFWNGSIARYHPYRRYGDVSRLVALQGVTLELGQRIPEHQMRSLAGEIALHEPGVKLLRLESRVTEVGLLAGEPAAVVTTDGCVRFDVKEPLARKGVWTTPWPHAEGGWLSEDQLPLLHTTVPRMSDVCFETKAWYASSAAYPVHYEEHLIVDGTVHKFWSQTLANLRTGSAPIPWAHTSGDEAPSPPRTAPASFAHHHFPADGPGMRLSFGLSRAITSVNEDARLAEFRAWRHAHPDALLVGAEYTSHRLNCPPTRHEYALSPALLVDKPSKIWSLVFGTPRGQYFAVLSAALPGADATINCEKGPMPGPAFATSQLAERSITLATAERTWSARSHSEGRDPNYIRWGAIWFCRENEYYETHHLCESGVYRVQLRPLDLERLEVGILETRPTQAGVYHGKVDEPVFYETLEIDVESGDVERHGYYGARYEHGAAPAAMALEGPVAITVLTASAPDQRLTLAIASTTGALALAALLAYALTSGWLPGYAKLRRSELLDNPVRDRILSVVREDPGISRSQIQKQVDAGWSTLVYHLSVLEKNNLVSSVLDGRHRRFFPSDGFDWSQRERLAALRNPRTKQLYRLLEQDPGLYLVAIAQRMRVSRTAASWHLHRLQSAGLVIRSRDGHKLRYIVNKGTPVQA